MPLTARDIAKMIDHSLLKPELTADEVVAGCKVAAEYGTATVCVRPCDVALAKETLKNSDVLTTTVIGFPHGSNVTAIKVAEAQQAMDDGAVELDLVLNIGRLKSRQFEYVESDIRAVVDAAHARGVIVKVILENCYLDDSLKQIACQLCERAGADYVKTSTGFGTSGATIEDLRLMRATVSPKVKVKAAGGIRTLGAVIAVAEAGAVRVGATATKVIMDEALERERAGTLGFVRGSVGGGY